MRYEKCGTQGRSRISSSWLNPHVFKRAFTQQSAIGHAVQCDPARKTQVLEPRFAMQMLSHREQDHFGNALNGCSKILFAIRDRRFWSSRRATKQLAEFRRRHSCSIQIREIVLVQSKRTVRLNIDHLIQNCIFVNRFAIRSEPHQFAFTAVDSKTTKRCERGVQQPERVRKPNLIGQLNSIVFTHS